MATTRTAKARRALALAGLALASAISAFVGGIPAQAAVGSDEFRASEVYRGDFADPAILRVGKKYYAYATNTGGKRLPAMSSTDLKTWTARFSETGKWWENEALTDPATWGMKRRTGNGETTMGTWAPSVARVQGRYVLAYVAPITYSPQKYCVSMAYAVGPLGPFQDASTKPIVCRKDIQSAIDPYVFVDRDDTPYLMWKTEGIPGSEPTHLWSQKMNKAATRFAKHSKPRKLLTTEQRWEGKLVENPAMIKYAGRYYLFYSANLWATADYATGYAVCAGPSGPCRRPAGKPLLATGKAVSGPGGADAFRGPGGSLRLGYAAWDRGRVGYPTSYACQSKPAGCNQRKLHVARLTVGRSGLLHVASRG